MAPIFCGLIFIGIIGMVVFDFVTSKNNEKEENRVRERVKKWLFRIGFVLTLIGTYLWEWICYPNIGWTCFNGIAFPLPISLPKSQTIEVDASVLMTVLLALVILFRISSFKYGKHVAFFGVSCLIAVSTYSDIIITRITQESV